MFLSWWSAVVERLSKWLRSRGNLALDSTSLQLYALGPALLFLAALACIKAEVSSRALFWIAAVASAVLGATYYLALLKAYTRQRGKFYRREVHPRLSREYREKPDQ